MADREMTFQPFKLALPSAHLSLERGTPDVPGDGRFHLVVGGQIVQNYRNRKEAEAEYQRRRLVFLTQHPPKKIKVDINDVMAKDMDRISNQWGRIVTKDRADL